MQIDRPYLLFLGDVSDQLAAKTAQESSIGVPIGVSASCGLTAARPIAASPT